MLELFEAVKGKAIIYSDLNDLRTVLRVVMLKVGLSPQNLPGKEETALLVDHILKNYGKHTNAEIRLAFDMALAGRLNIEENNIKCYGNFSCIYFSGIMNTYKEWARNNYKHEHQVKGVQKIYTEEEILNQRRGEIESAFQAIRTGHYPILHSYFFDVLLQDGLLLEHSEWEGEVEIERVAEFFVRKVNSQAENIYVKQ